MKKTVVLLYLVCIAYMAMASPKRIAPAYNVIFYNVENLFDTIDDPKTNDNEFLPGGPFKYTSQVYQTHLQRTSEVLAGICKKELPMFIGLAEIENRLVLEDLIAQDALRAYTLGIVHQNAPDERGIDVALLYNKSLCKLLKEEYLYVQIDTQPEFKTRMILHATFECFSGTQVHVYVNHWPSRREGEKETEYRRIEAAQTLRESTDMLLKNDPMSNIIVMGDFNDYPNNASIEKVLGAADWKTADKSEAQLYNISEADAQDTIVRGSHNFRGEWGCLDQIILSKNMLQWRGGAGATQLPYRIYYTPKMLYTDKNGKVSTNRMYAGTRFVGGYSDHLPVYIPCRF